MTNLVANGNFATGDFTDWTLGGNDSNASSPQIFIDTDGEGGSTYAAGLGSMGADGTLSQSIATTAGQTYTLSFWLQNEASGSNDFTAMWDGQPVLALTNASAFGYTEYTFTVTAFGSTSTLEFSAANGPSQWNLDNISLTAGSSTAAPAAPAISTGVANSNQSVTLTGSAPDGATVTVWDGATALGAATASSTGAWSLTTPDLSLGSYAFTATDATSAGSSAASSPFDVTVTTLPAPPAISTGVENSNQSVTMTGTAPGGATVTVSTLTTSDGVTTALGTTTASITGAWSFTTAALSAGIYDLTATDTTSAGTSSASNPFVVGVSSTNPDPVTYYVSSEIGNNANAGTSESAPLASLQAAEDLVQPGDTVEVMNGTYTGNAPGGGDVLDITTSGTASAPITFEAAPGQTPVINSSGGWNAINIEASYIVVEGFTVVGDAANYTLAQALAGYSTGNANLDGNGIAVIGSSAGGTGAAIPNHITIENNTVYDEPGGGIDTQGADYVQILNNVVYDNAHWSAYGNSGISINVSANSDTNAGVHDIISGNLVFGNAQEVPTTGGSTITDGEGIILDTNPGFTGEILVENNTVYNSGSSGIESFLTDNAVITGNTVYGNDTENVQAASVAQIFINQSNNDTVTNNTTTAPSSTPPAAPVISTGAENSNESVTLTGTAPDGSTVTVSDGGATALGTATASSTGAWSFTTADLAAGSYAFTATDTTSAGTSAASSAFDVTVADPPPPPDPPAAPVISTGVANSNESVTLTGTAPDGSTVTVSDGGTSALGIATASSTGAWSFTTADLSAGSYAFTATDTTSAGTSAASSPFDVTVADPPPPPDPPAAPVISTGVANSNESVTLKGTAPDGSTVTVSDGGTSALGTATASSTGAWSFTTADLAAGSYAFTATDTTSAGTSAASSAFDVTVTNSSPPPSGSNLVANGNFATGNFTDWTLGGNDSNASSPQIFIDTNADGGSTYAAGLGSMGADGTLSQTIATTAGQTYTLSFWLQNEGSGGNDFAAIWNGQTLLSLTNAAQFGYTEYTYTVTATGSTTTLEFSAANNPSQWDLDNISLTANGTSSTPPPPAAPVISTGVANSNESVTLTGTAPNGSTVTVSDGGTTALGTATASSTGAWSFTTADLAAGSYAFTATDTTSAGTSAASNAFDVMVTPPPPAAPVISTGVENSNESVTLTGTAPNGSTVTVSDGGATALGTATASSTGAWSFTTADLSAGSYAFTATDTTSAGTSAASSAFDVTVPDPPPPPDPPAAPVISTGVANSNESVTLTGTAPDGSTVTVSDGGTSALGIATASSTGAWSFTTADLSAGSYAFTATDTTSAGTSAASSAFDVTVADPPPPPDPPAAPVISTGVANSNESVTLTGTAPDGSTVTVSDGGTSALGIATASSTGAWSFTTADLSAGSYAFTATDTTSAGTSAASSAFDVTVADPPPPPDPPAAPVISTGVANSNESVTLKGTAPDGSTVTVSDGGTSALGTATASSTGAWSFTTADLSAGSYAFTATDTTSAGTSAASSAFDVTVTTPPRSNLVANGNFATGNFTDWTLGGNDSNASSPQLFIDTNADGGSTYAVGMGSMGADGTLSQTIATTAGQTYTLSFWLQNEGSGGNDFAAIWKGQTLLSLTNAAKFGYTEYTYTVTATGSTTTLEFSAANNPSQWDLDNISLTANSTPPPAAPVISTAVENSNKSVTLTGTAPDGSTVTVSDGGAKALGTATASSTGAWSFTTADLAAGSYAFTATDTTSAGNVSTASSALNVKVNAHSIGAVTIGTGATFELAAADSASVTFASSTGTLILESPSTFSGEIFNFTGNGSLSGSDQIDLTNINFKSVKDSYANGVLTVTDGTNTDKLDFNGSYKLANFDFASDGSGGTIVYDPPAPPSSALAATSSGQTSGGQGSNFTGTVSGFGAQDVIDLPGIAFDAQATLGYLPDSDQTGGTLPFMDGAQSAKIALIGNYMASSFAAVGDHHSDSMVTEAWQASNQSLLTHPQHT